MRCGRLESMTASLNSSRNRGNKEVIVKRVVAVEAVSLGVQVRVAYLDVGELEVAAGYHMLGSAAYLLLEVYVVSSLLLLRCGCPLPLVVQPMSAGDAQVVLVDLEPLLPLLPLAAW